MKTVVLRKAECASIEEAEHEVFLARCESNVLVRNLTRFNKEVDNEVYLSKYDHIPFRFNHHLDTVRKLYGKEDYLNDLEAQLRKDFKGVAKAEALLTRLDNLRSYVINHLEKSMGQMANCCLKYQPAYYSLTVDFIEDVLKALEQRGQIIALSNRLALSRAITIPKSKFQPERQASQFVTYFLVTTPDNVRHFLAVSALVDGYGRFKMGCALLPSMKVPGTFKSPHVIREHLACKSLIPKLLGCQVTFRGGKNED